MNLPLRWALFVIVGSLFFFGSGCMKSSPKRTVSPRGDQSEVIPQGVGTKQGSVTAYSKGTHRQPLYKVNWQSANIVAKSPGSFFATANVVSGLIMKAGVPVSRFIADKATVDRKNGVLKLLGKIKISQITYSNHGGAVLTCEKVTYSDSDQIIKAIGNVVLQSPTMQLTGLPSLYALPDFSEIGSPQMVARH